MVGFSEGTTSAFYAQSYLKNKVSLLVALGPVTAMKNVEFTMIADKNIFQMLLDTVKTVSAFEFFGKDHSKCSQQRETGVVNTLLESTCSLFNLDCENLSKEMYPARDAPYINSDRYDEYFGGVQGTSESGTSLKNVKHLGQCMISGKFQRYDYGL